MGDHPTNCFVFIPNLNFCWRNHVTSWSSRCLQGVFEIGEILINLCIPTVQRPTQHTSRIVLVQKVEDITFVLDCLLLVPAKNCYSDISFFYTWLGSHRLQLQAGRFFAELRQICGNEFSFKWPMCFCWGEQICHWYNFFQTPFWAMNSLKKPQLEDFSTVLNLHQLSDPKKKNS